MTKPLPRLVGVSGYARSGKSTFARALVERHGYTLVPFTDPLNELLYEMNPEIKSRFGDNTFPLADGVQLMGWEVLKDEYPEVRKMQQALGAGARTILGENTWVDAAMKKVDPYLKGSPANAPLSHFVKAVWRCFVFPNVRYQNEFDAIKERGGIIVRIEREGVKPVNGHDSETSIDDAEFDYVIHNNGSVADLRQQAFDVISKERGTYVWHEPKRLVVPRDARVVRSYIDVSDFDAQPLDEGVCGNGVYWTSGTHLDERELVDNPKRDGGRDVNVAENGMAYSPNGSSERTYG